MYYCYTDGSCKGGEKAPGGWGVCIKGPDGTLHERHGSAVETDSKTMEYTAVAEALDALPESAAATIFSDSRPLVENCSKRLGDWRESGWRTADPAIVALLRRIDALVVEKGLNLVWQWIRGHNGNLGNERADGLAAQGAREAKAALEAASSPGRPGTCRAHR
jgi:ribonuclease HI